MHAVTSIRFKHTAQETVDIAPVLQSNESMPHVNRSQCRIGAIFVCRNILNLLKHLRTLN